MLVLLGLALSAEHVLADVPDWVTGDTGLFKRDGGGPWQKVPWTGHADALDALLEHCCESFRGPFELPAGTTIVPGEDDKDLTRERTRAPGAGEFAHGPNNEQPVPGATLSHCGIDVGSRVTPDGGETIATLGSASVSPIHTGGYVRVTERGSVHQRVVCEHDGFRLVLEFSYGHVRPRRGLGRDWIETPQGPLGTLEGDDAWRSNDPRFKTKGNHIHLEVEGVYDKTFDSEMAHNLELDGQSIEDARADFLRRRRAFLNDCLLRKLRARTRTSQSHVGAQC